MDRLVDTLHVDELLRSAPRVVAILAIALAAGAALAPLFARWLRRAAPASDAAEVAALSSTLRRVALLVGLYQAVRTLPLPPGPTTAIEGLLFVVAALVAARGAIRTVRLLLHGFLERTAGEAQARARHDYLPVATTTATVAVALLAVIAVAHHFGQDVSSLVAAFGVGSLAIGLAAQQTLGNTIAGFTLLADRPFGPGDEIRLQSGETGEVGEIGIRSTRILLPDGNLLIVPNSELANTRVVNCSYPARSARAEVRLRVSRRADLAKVSGLLLELARAEEGVLAEPAPTVTVADVGGSGPELLVRMQVARPSARRAVEDHLRLTLAERIGSGTIPLPDAPPAAS